MDLTQENNLTIAIANLLRASRNKKIRNIQSAQRMIREAVLDIYTSAIDAPTVLRVEEILCDGYANIPGNSLAAEQHMEELVEKAVIGLEMHRKFKSNPKAYVANIEDANKGIGKSIGEGRRFQDGVPIEPIRAALIQFRKQLVTELSQSENKKNIHYAQTNRERLDAVIAAERGYLVRYLQYRNDFVQTKQAHLHHFDKRMKKILQEIEPRK